MFIEAYNCNTMSETTGSTVEEHINQIEDALTSVGYEAEAQPNLGIVKVYNPSDSQAMYEQVEEACDCSFDVAMTGATVFQIIVDN